MTRLTKIQKKVYNFLKKIPKGKVTTYKILAQAVGKSKNWRQIGKILNQNPYPCRFPRLSGGSPMRRPCYKVVKSNGEIGGYSQEVDKKMKLLQKDGIIIKGNKIQNFNKYLFN